MFFEIRSNTFYILNGTDLVDRVPCWLHWKNHSQFANRNSEMANMWLKANRSDNGSRRKE